MRRWGLDGQLVKRRHLTLRLLHRLGAGRRTAKTLFKAAGWWSRIKTPHRVHRWNGPAQPSTPARWRWAACNPSIRLLQVSMQLDWDHWDHWACINDHCAGVLCECGGTVCPHIDFDLDEVEA
jgi:hypothetical protein